jgi:hypothetical protein
MADPESCSFQFAPGELRGHIRFTSACDIVKNTLAARSVPYSNEPVPVGTTPAVQIGDQTIQAFPDDLAPELIEAEQTRFTEELTEAVNAAGYPVVADPERINKPMILLLLTILVLYVTMVYGPIAAWLVELFPNRIRYTSMSLPYHIGNGWFGGFLPTTAFALVLLTGNIYSGLWYPVIIAAMTFVVGTFFLPETKDVNISD